MEAPEELLFRLLLTIRTEGADSDPEPLLDLEDCECPCEVNVPLELALLSVLLGVFAFPFRGERRELSDCEAERERALLRARALEVIDSDIERMSVIDRDEMPDMR